ncbi:MAG TPA: class I SAM-dependent methyltransferase [Candidatus Sulfotelmatobacter sp.]|jgi:SAM-dependent methyltransferase|nr:class I SAM-dependent methyltransferase [Candidatus Sulfotelmatobacter sp.]
MRNIPIATVLSEPNTLAPKTGVGSLRQVAGSKDRSYWEARLASHWGLQGVGYLGYGVRYNNWLYAVRREILRRHLLSLSIELSRASVLDIGSGTGFWLEQWRALGVRSLKGSDVAAVAVERLKKTFPELDIAQIDIAETLDQCGRNAEFDVVSAFDVLFHITDDARFNRAIENVSTLLKRGGYFFFSDNFVHGTARRTDHQVSRSLNDIEAAVQKSGLKIVRRAPMFVLMNAPIDSSLPWLMPVWRAFLAPVHVVPLLGSVYGAVLYPIELTLTHLMSESPSTEIMICRKD